MFTRDSISFVRRISWRALMASLAIIAVVVVKADSASAAAITPGNLVVVQVGTGQATLSADATAAFLQEFTTAGGAPVQTIALPTADAGAQQILTLSGTSTSEGFLQISTNGQFLTLAGYDAAPGATGIVAADAAVVNRVVGRVTIGTGVVDTTTALNNAHSTSNIRSAITTNGTDIWTGGTGTGTAPSAPGVTYTTFGATTATRLNTSGASGTNRRVVGIFNGQLYVSGSTTGGPNFAINSIGTGTPTVPSAEANLPGFPIAAPHSTYDFWFRDANTVYLADDGNAASGGGIQKWTFNGTTWSLLYTLLNDGTTNTAVRGLAGLVAGSNTVLFGTTGGSLVSVTDTGVDNDLAVVLATAPINTAFRGVEIVPVPEPATLVLGGLGLIGLLGLARRRKIA